MKEDNNFNLIVAEEKTNSIKDFNVRDAKYIEFNSNINIFFEIKKETSNDVNTDIFRLFKNAKRFHMLL